MHTELKQDYAAIKGKHAELQKEHTEGTNRYNELKEKYDELKEEKHDYAEEMKDIYDRQKNELEEALKDIARMKKEHSDYERETTATIEKIQHELAAALETRRDRLLDEYYDLSTCQCDLIGLYKYCKAYRVPEDVRRSVLAADTREKLTLPATLMDDIRGGSVGEFLEWMTVPLPSLKTITGSFDSVETCYVQYRNGVNPVSTLQRYCEYGIRGEYKFTRESLLAVTAVGTCLEYFTTVLPLLPAVTSVKFPHYKDCTLPEDHHTMIGGGSVGEFIATVVDLLPEPKRVKSFYWSAYQCHLAYRAGDISYDVLRAFCYGVDINLLTVGTPEELSGGVPLGDYCETVLPLLPSVTGIRVGEKVDTVDWCATLPERITRVNFRGCKAIEDFTPLLAAEGVRRVYYDKGTNPSFKTIIGQLRNGGVRVEEMW
ncbi:hypothetical protein, conserved [Angomonas deanei]|uniref:Uncharacterized protein n=1 Tax=Angomonas deanei TaxID=59799 RepID=A0A7G2C267_9TRYP|nr:hypothetical protein, conserved [Angomonas deanei]